MIARRNVLIGPTVHRRMLERTADRDIFDTCQMPIDLLAQLSHRAGDPGAAGPANVHAVRVERGRRMRGLLQSYP